MVDKWITNLLMWMVALTSAIKTLVFILTLEMIMKNTDEAWINSRKFLEDNSERLLMVYRQLPGFENADFVWEKMLMIKVI